VDGGGVRIHRDTDRLTRSGPGRLGPLAHDQLRTVGRPADDVGLGTEELDDGHFGAQWPERVEAERLGSEAEDHAL
jgi:hypothetical protein